MGSVRGSAHQSWKDQCHLTGTTFDSMVVAECVNKEIIRLVRIWTDTICHSRANILSIYAFPDLGSLVLSTNVRLHCMWLCSMRSVKNITDNFATSFLPFSCLHFSLWGSHVHSLMLSSHVHLLLSPFHCASPGGFLARPDEREIWPYHCSSRHFTSVRRSLCGPIIACWVHIHI